MSKEIRVTEDELKQMLKGTLLWSDIAPRLNPPPGARSGIRKLGTSISSRQPNASDSDSADSNSHISDFGNTKFNSNPIPNEGDNDLKEVRALLYERRESYYHQAFEGTKVVVSLSFAGVAVVSLWLYYFLKA